MAEVLSGIASFVLGAAMIVGVALAVRAWHRNRRWRLYPEEELLSKILATEVKRAEAHLRDDAVTVVHCDTALKGMRRCMGDAEKLRDATRATSWTWAAWERIVKTNGRVKVDVPWPPPAAP